MKIYNASKTPLNIIRIITAVITIALIVLCRLFIPFHILMISLISLFAAVGIILIFLYFPAMFRNMEFYTDENIITKRNGVLFKHEQTINISSIQYITSIYCKFIDGFCFIVLNIYGGIMILPFLNQKNFKSIINDLEYTVIRK